MAKVKYNSTHHLQKFFIIFGVIFSLVALGIILYSSQQKTIISSNASGCTDKPKLILDAGSNYPGARFVAYHLKLINNCPNPKRFRITVNTPNEPVKYNNWKWGLEEGLDAPILNNNPILTKYVENKPADIALSVGRPLEVKNMQKGEYRYFTVKASLEKNDNIYDTINLIYKVD